MFGLRQHTFIDVISMNDVPVASVLYHLNISGNDVSGPNCKYAYVLQLCVVMCRQKNDRKKE